MKNERLGLIMIAASIVAAVFVLWLVNDQQTRLHRDKVRIQGVAMTRAMIGASLAQLAPRAGSPSLLEQLASVQPGDAFAYGAVVTPSGGKLFEVASAGTIVPPAAMPTDPPSWFGERALVSPGDGRRIREFFGPIINDGDLAGFARSGYYEAPSTLPLPQISSLALLALPIFLLTAMMYLFVRRELRPLALLGEKVAGLDELARLPANALRGRLELKNYMLEMEGHVTNVQARIGELESRCFEARTSNRLLTYKQEKTQAVLDSMPEAVLVLDPAGLPVFANVRSEAFTGTSRDAIVGCDPQTWCKEPEVLTFLARLALQGRSPFEAPSLVYSPAQQPDRKISATATPLLTPHDAGNRFGTLVIFRDVTFEVTSRQAGSDFVAYAAHELKSPLNTLSAYTELLLDFERLEDAERIKAINVIHDEAERAATLIGNLLNISKLESGTLPLSRQRVRLGELLRDSTDKIAKNAELRDISIELHQHKDIDSVELDKELFRIAIDNLLGNAVKYSDPGGQVSVSVAHGSEQELRICVADRGIGMSAEDCRKVFDKYHRSGDAAAASRPGNGLGLYVANQIAKLHHGKLSVTSELGKGTRFTLAIPVQAARLQEAA